MKPLIIAAVLQQLAGSPTLQVPPPLAQLLTTGRWDATPPSFRIIALSQLADGCVGQALAVEGTSAAAHQCVEDVLRVALRLGPSRHALHRTHLNLIYGAADRVGPCLDAAAHERLARGLALESLADPHAHAASYEGNPLRWPADQSATLASLARYDAAHGATLLDSPRAKWVETMQGHLHPATALPVSELTGRGPGAKWPRGCAQSFLTRYLSEVDPALSATWWAAYRAHFFERLGPVVGFREWPRGVNRAADLDSGPIVWGIGAAASALGVAAARSQGDFALATQLEASQAAALSTGAGGRAAQTVLAAAIQFNGRWQPAWASVTHREGTGELLGAPGRDEAGGRHPAPP